jgi:hypothetical protein
LDANITRHREQQLPQKHRAAGARSRDSQILLWVIQKIASEVWSIGSRRTGVKANREAGS